ncbi:MAG: hypothetical protein QG671_2856 [Actinomycetota bacterium]|nr:hypothetical protein [Actinomycetota bacterium]
MVPKYRTSVDIAATRETIWSILTDASAYADWNPTLSQVRGNFELGESVVFVPADGGGRGFKVKVVELEPESRLVCRGGMPFRLFTGSRTFQLGEAGDLVRFEMFEEFSGPLARLVSATMPDQQPAFDAFATALRDASELATKPRARRRRR